MEADNDSESQQSNSQENNNNENIRDYNNSKVAQPPPPPHVVTPVPGQQWVAMQYPTAAMVMQHGMMPPPHYPPHYMPYHHPHYQHHNPPPTPPHQSQSSDGNEENRTLWVGDLDYWMEEDYLRRCFASTREVASIKVIRNKQTRFTEGYGFVEFFTHAAAEKVLETYTSFIMPKTDHLFRLNWATFSMGDKRSNNSSDLSIFVGDLAADVTDTLLHETFACKYSSVKGAKVVIDANTGRSKGYGFVRFGDDDERSQALTEMNGVYCLSRPMRIGAATPRKTSGFLPPYSPQVGGYSNGVLAQVSQSDAESVNTTIFVGGLDPNVTDDELRQPFLEYGEIISVKIPVGKGCGFVQFASRNEAETALEKLNGTTIGKQTVRLSWGRNPMNKQSRAEYGNQWTGQYYGVPFYDGYGYALPQPAHDSSMYPAAVYGAYPTYGTHQQQVS
ncbi:polyadenylate-binding protein RBP47-like isoform X1 [Primulina tabacum]|uniref:polyadenylate-binding protein RBP47-like isoform X1 n=1 Tax=Primulina tabacum TaxID=48773 RepID=UPI003F5A8D8B